MVTWFGQSAYTLPTSYFSELFIVKDTKTNKETEGIMPNETKH